jgi:hypothetical protein
MPTSSEQKTTSPSTPQKRNLCARRHIYIHPMEPELDHTRIAKPKGDVRKIMQQVYLESLPGSRREEV